jgi:hypothetical protein
MGTADTFLIAYLKVVISQPLSQLEEKSGPLSARTGGKFFLPVARAAVTLAFFAHVFHPSCSQKVLYRGPITAEE